MMKMWKDRFICSENAITPGVCTEAVSRDKYLGCVS